MSDLRNSHEWAMFLGGHWQKEMPEREGEFPVIDKDGDHLRRDVSFNQYGQKWFSLGRMGIAWWWSEPLPKMPDPEPGEGR